MTEISEPTVDADRSGDDTSLNTRDMRRVLVSCFIGGVIEYYDFVLYAVAASVVFAEVFFAGLGPGFALFASFATLAIGYLMRPLGGIVFGHFGDRIGRKKMLIVGMFLMGTASCLIGVLPTTAQIGVVAPVALILLRMVQGFAVGGEWGGATLTALEHAPQKKRGFATSFANVGGPVGAILATLAVSLFTFVAGDSFLTWGWRVPFLLSAVLVIFGLVVRLKISETPVFQRMEERSEKKRIPLRDVLRDHPRPVLVAFLATSGFYVFQSLITVWGVSQAVDNGVNQASVLNVKAFGAAVTVVTIFVSARLSDRIGRKRMLIAASTTGAVLAYPLLLLLTNGTLWGFAVADIVGSGIIMGFLYGPLGAFVAELFPTRLRYSGFTVASQSASTLAGGFSPMIAVGLMIATGGSIWLVGVFWIAILVAGIIAIRSTREGSKVELG